MYEDEEASLSIVSSSVNSIMFEKEEASSSIPATVNAPLSSHTKVIKEEEASSSSNKIVCEDKEVSLSIVTPP